MNWHYIWWVPSLVGIHVYLAYLSKVNNEAGGDKNTMITMWVLGGIFQLWVIVSAVSKNLLFDAMLYDNLLFLSYTIPLILWGCATKFVAHQWIGLVLIVIGSILIRLVKG